MALCMCTSVLRTLDRTKAAEYFIGGVPWNPQTLPWIHHCYLLPLKCLEVDHTPVRRVAIELIRSFFNDIKKDFLNETKK